MRTQTVRFASAAALMVVVAGSASAQCAGFQKLNRVGATANERLGSGVAIDLRPTSPIMVVGIPGNDGPGGTDVGSFSVWAKGQSWSSLGGSFGPTANDRMGTSVDIAYPYVIAGAPGYNTNRGRARVYRTDNGGSNWTFESDLFSFFPNQDDLAGQSVAISAYGGGWAVIGAPNHSFHSVSQAGAAFFFTRDANGAWTNAFTIWGGDFNGKTAEHRGTAVAMSKTSRYAVVGGPGGNASGQPTDSGVAYMAQKLDNGLVGAPAVISPATGYENGNFGQAVAIEGDLMVIGAPGEPKPLLFGSVASAGRVHVYERSGNSWNVVAVLTASDAVSGLRFGSGVATDGSRIAVYGESTKTVYVFEKIDGVWAQTNKFSDPDGVSTFGTSLDILDSNIAVGDLGDDEASVTDRGAVYGISLQNGQPSDVCSGAGAMPLSEFQACTTYATSSGNSTTCGTGGAGQGPDIWYSFTPTCSGNAIIDTFGSDFDTVLSVHSACPSTIINNTNTLVCNDDASFPAPNNRASLVTFNFAAGETYFVRIAGYNGASGIANVRPSFYYSYPNDVCTGAVTVTEGSHTFGNCGANTEDTAGMCPSDGFVPRHDLWYSFSPAQSGEYRIDTCGTSFDTVLAVYEGCPVSGQTPIACDDDHGTGCGLQAGVFATLTAGTSYRIRVGSFSPNVTGAFNLNIMPPAAPCDPDVNQDGNVDQDDVAYLINVVGGGANPTGIDPDINHDGNVDQDDVAALINVVAGGDCP
ncbi:MAG: hypothetical protein DYG92_06865 [Leptolyngbya sp. PLA1]|nr:hypothetical protein [Leptolyngbya sp. PLA1]